eukprot:6266720-Amphidinium_carterae.1
MSLLQCARGRMLFLSGLRREADTTAWSECFLNQFIRNTHCQKLLKLPDNWIWVSFTKFFKRFHHGCFVL